MEKQHQMFVQAIISHRFVTQKEALGLYVKCCSAYNAKHARTLKDMQAFVGVINQELSPCFLKIASVMREDTGATVWGLINQTSDELASAAGSTTHSKAEIAFFKRLVEMIVQAELGAVSSMDSLAMARTLEQPLTGTVCEHLCDTLITEGWLCEPKQGMYALGPRALLELPVHLKQAYPEAAAIKDCKVCHKPAFLGQCCPKCGSKLHVPCLARFFRGTAEPKCLQCHDIWPFPVVTDGLESDSEGEAEPVAARAGAASASSSRTTMRTKVVDDGTGPMRRERSSRARRSSRL